MDLFSIKRLCRSLLCTLLVLLLAGFRCALSVLAADSSEQQLFEDYIYYTITEENEVVINSARASITEAVIPATIDGCPVTEIESYAFQGCTRLTSLILPETIRKIGDFAFLGCKRLETLQIPDSVENVGWGIVKDTLWLSQQTEDFVIAGQGILLAYTGTEQQVVVPEGVQTIGGYAFFNCNTAENVTLPSTVTMIDAFAFDKCLKMRQITIPDSVQSIGEYAFHWCVSLEQIELPDSVTSVEHHAFSYCKALQSVKFSKGMQQLSTAMFSNCQSLQSIVLPDNIRVLYNYVFQDCTSLKEVVLPSGVEEIGLGVFDGCTALDSLTIQNLACRIYDDAGLAPEQTTICGSIGSTAQIYSGKYGYSFLALDRIRGDYDGDGKITMMDAYWVLMFHSSIAAGLVTEPTSSLTDGQRYASDYDADGSITMQDAYQILLCSSRISIGAEEAA